MLHKKLVALFAIFPLYFVIKYTKVVLRLKQAKGRNMKKVSIIIPAYNAESTIEECYKSILNQTYTNYEVITINDGSKDNTLAIMQKFADADKRFVSVDSANCGVSHARNTGLSKATGEYIMFVDADDTLDKTMLAKLVGLIEKNNADMAVCKFTHPYFHCYIENDLYDITKTSELLRLYQDPFALNMPWNKIAKRSALTVPFDEEEKFSEDELFNLANLKNMKKVATTSEYLYKYFIIADPKDPRTQNSCIGRLASLIKTGKPYMSLYWMGTKLLPKRRQAAKNGIKEGTLNLKQAEDICYLRLVDYAFYQMPIYIGMGVSKRLLVQEWRTILEDVNFQTAFKFEEKYGYRLKKLDIIQKEIKIRQFVDLCFKLFKDKNNDEEFKSLFAYVSVFLALFAEQTAMLNETSFKAKFILDMQYNKTKEAEYVRSLIHDTIPNDNLCCFVHGSAF